MKRFLFSAFILLIVSAVSSQSQNLNSVGLSASLQNDQYGIAIPVRVTEMTVLVPSIDIRMVEDVATDFILGLSARYYRKHDNISPYFGFNFAVAYMSPSETREDVESTTDLILGPTFGAEYYLGTAFSIGLEVQANLSKADGRSRRFGHPGSVNFNLATVLFATIYFD